MKRFRRVLKQAIQEPTISMADCLMYGLDLFSLKYPSLLKFDNDRADDIIQHNLRSLYGIRNVPCDTYMRERLDKLSPHLLRKTFTTLFAQVQRVMN